MTQIIRLKETRKNPRLDVRNHRSRKQSVNFSKKKEVKWFDAASITK